MRSLSALLMILAVVNPCAVGAESPADARRTPVVVVFEAAKDAVVNISSTQIIETRSPLGFDRMFEEFFDLPSRRGFTRRFKRTSVGSGFVLHAAGYIVTNAHVVARTADRKAIFADEREFDAAIVAIDHERDLAVLKIEPPQPLTPLPLGRSGDLMVGETVIAIGNPLGYQHTVTAGVVSALGRTLEISQDVAFHGLIQTDASINPGNSGGPLLNILGELIGVNMAIRGDAQNIGFAIPVDQLRSVLPELLDVERRYGILTGVRVGPGEPCRVLAVVEDGPADQAGIELGDVITAVGDHVVGGGIDFHVSLIGRRAGQATLVTVRRGDETAQLPITFAERPAPDGAVLLKEKLGVEAVALTSRMAGALGLREPVGLMVTGVEPGSPAAATGFKRGDVLFQIGRHEITSLKDVGQLLEQVGPGDALRVSILRVSGRVTYRLSTEIKAR